MLIGTVLVALIGVQVVRTLVRLASGRSDLKLDPLIEPRDALGKRVGLVLLTVVFIAAMPWLGLSLSLFLGLAAALVSDGCSQPRASVLGVLWRGRVGLSAFHRYAQCGPPARAGRECLDALTALFRK